MGVRGPRLRAVEDGKDAGRPTILQAERFEDPKVGVQHEHPRRPAGAVDGGDPASASRNAGIRRDVLGGQPDRPDEMDGHLVGDAITEAFGEITNRRGGRGPGKDEAGTPPAFAWKRAGVPSAPGRAKSGARSPRPRGVVRLVGKRPDLGPSRCDADDVEALAELSVGRAAIVGDEIDLQEPRPGVVPVGEGGASVR